MICLQVQINGTTVCTAGGTDLATTSANVYAFVLDDGATQLTLSVRGQTAGGEKGESVLWLRQDLSVGDKISIQIVEQPACDPPVRRSGE
jgi:hypothetical protein